MNKFSKVFRKLSHEAEKHNKRMQSDAGKAGAADAERYVAFCKD